MTAIRQVRLQAGQGLERRIAQALVLDDEMRRAERLAVFAEVRCIDRMDLRVEGACFPGGLRNVLRALAEGVEFLARDVPLLGDALGALELRGQLVMLPVVLVDGLADVGSRGIVAPIDTLLITSTPQPIAESTTPDFTSA